MNDDSSERPDRLRAERAAQGLTPTVTSPLILARVAALLLAPEESGSDDVDPKAPAARPSDAAESSRERHEDPGPSRRRAA